MKPNQAYKGLKALPNTDTHNCFACSPGNASGLQMTFYTDEERVYSWVTIPDHMGGWNNIAHGGILSTILDETMGWAGIYLLEQLTLTKTMTIDFTKAVVVGDQLRVEGATAALAFLCSGSHHDTYILTVLTTQSFSIERRSQSCHHSRVNDHP